MALRNILTDGDPALRKRSREVDKVDDRIRTVLDDMLETMRNHNGVGIAAPQVGVLRRMFIVETVPGEVLEIINPEIVETEGVIEEEEGCLSVPGVFGTVERPQRLRLRGLDRNGTPFEREAEGFEAVAICHEYDHLEGVLFTDRAKELHQARPAEEAESETLDARVRREKGR